jgi:hypothetical protein
MPEYSVANRRSGALHAGDDLVGHQPLLDRAGVVLLTKRLGSSARFDRITLTLLHRSA